MSPAEWVSITQAAEILHRSVWTVRRWDIEGRAPCGTPIRSARDEFTNIRWFRRDTILTIREHMQGRWDRVAASQQSG